MKRMLYGQRLAAACVLLSAMAHADTFQEPTASGRYVLRDPAKGAVNVIPNVIQAFVSTALFTRSGNDSEAAYLASFYRIPQAIAGAVMTPRNQPVPITLTANYVSSTTPAPQLVWSIVNPPIHGQIGGAAPALTYTPAPGFTGFDRLTFKVDDQVNGSTTARVEIKVDGSYTLFESGQVRPLALSSDGTRLYAVNTPDARLAIFDITQAQPKLINEVPVGQEPIAVALRNDHEAWVVNAISDDVSIVDVGSAVPYVKRTLQVGDQPMDVVFAGPSKQRAFITTAHRGQNSPSDPQFNTPGVGRADVWVFDASAVDSTQGDAKPLTILTLFGTPPRGLAVSPDGGTVYAAIYKSGNQTAVVGQNAVAAGPHSTKNGKPGPLTDASGKRGPNTATIVQFNGKHWVDSYGREWDDYVRFSLPDKDVFLIDANASIPKIKSDFAHVGTSLFNLAVNPRSGAVYVSNLEARNLNRFEGNGARADQMTVNGRFIYNRITVIKNGEVLPRNLDKHLSDASPTGSAADNAASLAMPLQMQVDAAGQTLYVAAFGSSKVGVFDVAQLENDSFVPSPDSHIQVSGGGPSGLVLDEARGRMFVMTRFDDGISVVDLASRTEVSHLQMYSPEPDFIVNGRPFLYDARTSSSKGDASCSSCHLFGDMDGLAWDLGNPDSTWQPNPRHYADPATVIFATRANHPLKGPMTTQSLRGLEFQGPQHWRGDRTGSPRYNGDSLERTAFKQFNVAFLSLLGNTAEPSAAQLDSFADFALQLRYPPNPIRKLDDTLTTAQADGENTFFNVLTTGVLPPNGNSAAMVPCNTCHTLDPDAQRFGTSTLMTFEGFDVSQNMKVPHLRNVYEKLGMFGMSNRVGTTPNEGPQIVGYGILNEGSIDTIQHFLSSSIFHVPADKLDNLIDFITVMDTGFAPMVGQQFTLTAQTTAAQSRIDALIGQALAHTKPGGPKIQRCQLIAKGVVAGKAHGWILQDSGSFQPDDPSAGMSSDAALRQLASAPGNALTYTCVPPGDGMRAGIDRDEDGIDDAVDTATAGRAPTSIANFDPNAPMEVDTMEDAASGGFELELLEIQNGVWPSFGIF